MRRFSVTLLSAALIASLGCRTVELRGDVELTNLVAGTQVGFVGERNCIFFLPSGFEVEIADNNSQRALIAKGDELKLDSPHVHGSVYVAEIRSTPEAFVEQNNITVRNHVSSYRDAKILESEVYYGSVENRMYFVRVSVGDHNLLLAASQKEHLPVLSELIDPCL